jgi:hypothetical protein
VLRSNPESGKRHAYIFDPVTLTDREVPVQNSELARMISFAQDADNSKILLVLEELRSRMFQETGEWPEYDIENEDLVEVEVGA